MLKKYCNLIKTVRYLNVIPVSNCFTTWQCNTLQYFTSPLFGCLTHSQSAIASSGWYIFGSSSIDATSVMIKIFKTQTWQFVSPSKVSSVKTFYDHGDLEIKFKVKLMTYNIVIMHLACKYQVSNGHWFMDVCLSHWL